MFKEQFIFIQKSKWMIENTVKNKISIQLNLVNTR